MQASSVAHGMEQLIQISLTITLGVSHATPAGNAVVLIITADAAISLALPTGPKPLPLMKVDPPLKGVAPTKVAARSLAKLLAVAARGSLIAMLEMAFGVL